jgi:hypothetical protein
MKENKKQLKVFHEPPSLRRNEDPACDVCGARSHAREEEYR